MINMSNMHKMMFNSLERRINVVWFIFSCSMIYLIPNSKYCSSKWHGKILYVRCAIIAFIVSIESIWNRCLRIIKSLYTFFGFSLFGKTFHIPYFIQCEMLKLLSIFSTQNSLINVPSICQIAYAIYLHVRVMEIWNYVLLK